MKMTKVDVLPPSASGKKKMPKNLAILQEFLSLGLDLVLLEDYPHKDSYSCATALSRSARNFGLPCPCCEQGRPGLSSQRRIPPSFEAVVNLPIKL